MLIDSVLSILELLEVKEVTMTSMESDKNRNNSITTDAMKECLRPPRVQLQAIELDRVISMMNNCQDNTVFSEEYKKNLWFVFTLEI